jgi:hypothetical protein
VDALADLAYPQFLEVLQRVFSALPNGRANNWVHPCLRRIGPLMIGIQPLQTAEQATRNLTAHLVLFRVVSENEARRLERAPGLRGDPTHHWPTVKEEMSACL